MADYNAQHLHTAADILLELLKKRNSISSVLLSRELDRANITNQKPILDALSRIADGATDDEGVANFVGKIFKRGRTFYSKSGLDTLEKEAERMESAAISEVQQSEADEEIQVPKKEKVKRKQDEARLIPHIMQAIANIYQDDATPEGVKYVFGVHNTHAGNEFENVDVLGFHWRAQEDIEVVTVEAKLEFTARLVQQANNYRRFSHRVWIALPGHTENTLRDEDQHLFDFVIESGLGIMLSQNSKKNIEFRPIHWPRLQAPNRFEMLRFQERYLDQFTEARAAQRKDRIGRIS